MTNERMDLDTAYRAVRGSLPGRRDVEQWKESQFLSLFEFIEHVCEARKGTISVVVTKEKWLAVEKVLDLPYHPWQEILYRLDRLTKDTRFNAGSCYIRIAAMNRSVLGYLKNNPAAITETMRKSIEPNPRLNWCLRNFADKTTKIGAEVVELAKVDATGSYPKPIGQRSPDRIMLEGQLKVFSIFEMIAKSINSKDIKEMDVRDKISALQKLSFIFNVASRFKANSQTFINLNVNAAKREDLEKALLDFGRHKEQEV